MRTYRLAVIGDADRLLALCRQARFKVDRFPDRTFVAEEDGVIQAALGLDYSGDYTVAGPLIVPKNQQGKRWMVLRLVETMERYLMERGVTKYLLSVACNNRRWGRIIQHIGCRPYAVRDGRRWYIREVGQYGAV